MEYTWAEAEKAYAEYQEKCASRGWCMETWESYFRRDNVLEKSQG